VLTAVVDQEGIVGNVRTVVSRFALPSVFLVVAAAVIPAMWLSFDASVPGPALLIIGAALLLAIGWAAISLSFRGVTIPIGMRALSLIYAIGGRVFPRGVTVSETEGTCPYGFKVGDSFTVDRQGRLSKPICSTAAEALEKASTERLPRENAIVGCTCPMGRIGLTFHMDPSINGPA
jgi:hypothetical protein